MSATIEQLATAREVVAKLLEELQLDAYLFEVEPLEGPWEVKVECPVEGGWETFRLTIKKEYLLRGIDEAVLHEMLLDDWREALSACRVKA